MFFMGGLLFSNRVGVSLAHFVIWFASGSKEGILGSAG